ncbi:unnamed protein product [Haemonchus placei]|uniref:GAT domain-containing protein n=1 Tax=Haemonchus placei TaxID=6290 RepID=A0A0N4WHZ3_HAEPC|nr:unnamed protein product [Haemonchus placei]
MQLEALYEELSVVEQLHHTTLLPEEEKDATAVDKLLHELDYTVDIFLMDLIMHTNEKDLMCDTDSTDSGETTEEDSCETAIEDSDSEKENEDLESDEEKRFPDDYDLLAPIRPFIRYNEDTHHLEYHRYHEEETTQKEDSPDFFPTANSIPATNNQPTPDQNPVVPDQNLVVNPAYLSDSSSSSDDDDLFHEVNIVPNVIPDSDNNFNQPNSDEVAAPIPEGAMPVEANRTLSLSSEPVFMSMSRSGDGQEISGLFLLLTDGNGKNSSKQ